LLRVNLTTTGEIIPRRKLPIFGSLPYRNLNYPVKEPVRTPVIKPAYQGEMRLFFPMIPRGLPSADL
jgi:hypothetical protein